MNEATLDLLREQYKKKSKQFEKDSQQELNKIRKTHKWRANLSRKAALQFKDEDYKQVLADLRNGKRLQKEKQSLIDEVNKYSDRVSQIYERSWEKARSQETYKNRILKLIDEETHGFQFVLLFHIMSLVLKSTENIAMIEKEYKQWMVQDWSIGKLSSLINERDLIKNAPLTSGHSQEHKSVLEKVKNTGLSVIQMCKPAPKPFQTTCATETHAMGNQINQNLEKRKEELDVENEELKEKQKKDQENEQREMVDFNEEMKMLKENEEDEEKRRKSNENRSSYLDEKLMRRKEENERKLKEKQRENEEYEKETKRRQQEAFENFKKSTDLIIEFVCQQLRFESKEKEWANWLKLLQDAIARAKNQYIVFQSHMGYLKDERSLRNELKKVDRETRIAYKMMYKAWEVVKQYSDNYEDKIFLRILLFNFQNITDKLCDILEAIDSFDTSSPNPEKAIRVAFYQVNAFDILSTAQLRLKSTTARFEDYQNCREPRVYCKSV